MRYLLPLALLAGLTLLCGCDYVGDYQEPELIEPGSGAPKEGRIDLEKVLYDGHVAGYVESVYHPRREAVDYFVYSSNLKPIGYIHEDGTTYRYSDRFDKLTRVGDYPLQGAVQELLGIQGGYYVVPAKWEVTFEEMEQLQPGSAAARRKAAAAVEAMPAE